MNTLRTLRNNFVVSKYCYTASLNFTNFNIANLTDWVASTDGNLYIVQISNFVKCTVHRSGRLNVFGHLALLAAQARIERIIDTLNTRNVPAILDLDTGVLLNLTYCETTLGFQPDIRLICEANQHVKLINQPNSCATIVYDLGDIHRMCSYQIFPSGRIMIKTRNEVLAHNQLLNISQLVGIADL